MESIVYVGMDVHKATYSLCALDKATGTLLERESCYTLAHNRTTLPANATLAIAARGSDTHIYAIARVLSRARINKTHA